MFSTPPSAWLARARAARRVAFRSGSLEELRPPAIAAALRARVAGPLGVSALLRIHAAGRPHEEAVVFEGRRWTWSEADARIDRLASAFKREVELRRGDAAVLALHNRPEVLEAQAALARIGCSAVSTSWRSTSSELAYIVEHSGAKAVLVEADHAEACLALRPRLARVGARGLIAVGGDREGLVSYEHLLRRGRDERTDEPEGAVVIYTSGTTGKPKGAVRRFPESMVWAVLHVLDELQLRADDRHLAVCPMYHSTAFGFIGLTMTLGGTVVIERSFDPERFLAVIERERITTTAVVPTMLHRVLSLPEATRRRYDTRSLRGVFCGGAPLSGELARRSIEALGPVLYNFYGATETGLNTIANSDELLRSPGTIGHAIGGNDLRILDDQGNEVRAGETGELWVKNTMLVEGYHRDEQATRSSMREGFFSVGDLAHRDARGLYHLDGRKRDMIISGGVNVYPAEVEEALSAHPGVGEVAVVGVPDEEWGERVRAFVVARPGLELDPSELLAFARTRLAGAKVPREIRQLDELPKNPTGKVLKRELRSLP
jgi:fatty-acyl-CoA synthase